MVPLLVKVLNNDWQWLKEIFDHSNTEILNVSFVYTFNVAAMHFSSRPSLHHDDQNHHILSLQFLRSREELYIVHDIMFIKNKRSLISGPPTNM